MGQTCVPYTRAVEIVQNGTDLILTGFGGVLDPWFGTVSGSTLQFGGMAPEGFGVTTSEITATLATAGQTFRENEAWSWAASSGQIGACPNGTSDVIGERLP